MRRDVTVHDPARALAARLAARAPVLSYETALEWSTDLLTDGTVEQALSAIVEATRTSDRPTLALLRRVRDAQRRAAPDDRRALPAYTTPSPEQAERSAQRAREIVAQLARAKESR